VTVPLVPVITAQGRPLYSLQPKQLQCFHLTPLYAGARGKEHIGYGGSGGSGKSYLARAVAVAAAGIWRGSTGIIFRKTEGEVLENHYQKLRTELPLEIDHEGQRVPFYSWNGKEMAFTFPLWKNSRILLGHLKNDDDIYKYQGNEYDWMIFEEATHYPWASVSWLVNFRLRATVPGARPFVIYPSNPGNVGHQWYKRLFIDRRFRGEEEPNTYAFVQAFLADNQELLKRDPGYPKKLDRLDEPWRSWVRDGNWSAGAGIALSQLNERIHMIDPFEVPRHWKRFGSFDWGYSHPFAFGEYAVSEDGDLFKLQTITGRHLQPHEIAERITSKLDPKLLSYIVAGLDAFHVHKARGDNTPTIAEQMGKLGLPLREANVERVNGCNNLRGYLAWKNTGPGGVEGDPALRFFRNEGNVRCYNQLEAMVPDPDDPEDVLKVDADEYGESGDDFYDETRYACASRPRKTPSMFVRGNVSAFSPESLKADVERLYRREDTRPKMPPNNRMPPLHPEFGDML
jgi:phage terminase large subunit